MKRLLAQALPVAGRALNDKHRFVQPEALNVAPQLVGAPLARPSRRAFALGVDLAVVALLSGVGGLWLLVGLALVILQLRSRRGAVASDTPARSRRRVWIGWGGAALVLLLAAGEAQERWEAWRDPQATQRKISAEQAEALEEVADALEAAQAQASIPDAAVRKLRRLAAPASVPAASLAASGIPLPSPEQVRIAQLEAQLKEARRKQALSWGEQWKRLVDDIGSGLGWGIVYFSLLPAWWGGQTVGKKIFGLRVVELTGKPMTVMRCLKRYGGYAAGMATGGLGFAQVLWDVNRQALQDKSAHTVVIDLRAAAQPSPQPSPPLTPRSDILGMPLRGAPAHDADPPPAG